MKEELAAMYVHMWCRCGREVQLQFRGDTAACPKCGRTFRVSSGMAPDATWTVGRHLPNIETKEAEQETT